MSEPTVRHPIQHIGYLVDDIPKAVDRWVATFGAGPFFWLGRHIQFDRAEHRGQPCILDHSAAIGKWGDTFVEFLQIYEVAPPTLGQAMAPGGLLGPASELARPHHICIAVDDPASEGARLESLGLAKALDVALGPNEVSYYDGRDRLGHVIEVQQNSAGFLGLFDMIAAAALDWDGKDSLRELGH